MINEPIISYVVLNYMLDGNYREVNWYVPISQQEEVRRAINDFITCMQDIKEAKNE